MPRLGKGKPMDVQAHAVLKSFLDLSSRHAAKLAGDVKGSQATGKIHSLRTFEKYTDSVKLAGEWGREHAGIRHLRDMTPELAQAYLEDRAAQGIGQKQLDADRNALQFITGRDTLERLRTLTPAERNSRAYTPAQVQAIAGRQSERNALATEISHRSGVRAHELLTIRSADTAQASAHRTWRAGRFAEREGVRYIVEGKGGLRREILVDHELAARLETHRAVQLTGQQWFHLLVKRPSNRVLVRRKGVGLRRLRLTLSRAQLTLVSQPKLHIWLQAD